MGSDSPVLVGVNYRTAPLDLREAMSFSASEATDMLRAASEKGPVAEAAVLSTCNRTEFYLSSPGPTPPDSAWFDWLAEWRPRPVLDAFRGYAYRKTGADAAKHLFRVAAGLDSAVLGDVQIQAQVKEAMRLSARAGVLKSHLNQLMTQAIRSGRRARTDTRISAGSPSIGSAVFRLLLDRLAALELTAPTVVLVGGGKAAATIARPLGGLTGAKLVFVNRTAAPAAAWAARYGGEAVPWNHLPECVARADVLITATAAAQPIVTRPMLDAAVRSRSRPLLVIDPSVPRNVEDAAGVRRLDIDSVQHHRDAHLAVRKDAQRAVEAIVMVEVENWLQWSAQRPVEDLIRRLYGEADRLAGPASAGVRDAASPDDAARRLRSSFRQLLHEHVRELRELVVRSHPSGPGHGADLEKSRAPEG